jgi:hypothetical protein
MRILSPIVQRFMLAMFEAKAHLCPRSAIRTELDCNHDTRRRNGGFQEPPHEPLPGARVSSELNHDVEHAAILVDGSPQQLLAGDRHDDLIHVPFVAASRSRWRI